MNQKLSLATLDGLGSGIAVPSYQRSDLSAGIVHVGVGNFHRAHQAVYLHRLFSTGRDLDWAIVGGGIKHFDAAMRNRLAGQDWLTTIVELDPEGLSAQISGAMIDFVEVNATKLVARMAQPDIRIVSLTVTEGGYFVDAKSGGFDARHPEILADIANPDAPATVFGIMIAALQRRRAAGIAPFTIMSCDNLPENGHVTREAVLGMAKLMSGGLARWIEEHVAFPNSMVDCITPATGDRERTMVREKFGIEDAAPVVCEPFRQWVLEDRFPLGRPALETVGVEFVTDVAPYELMKLRILNGGHAAIAYPSGLLGHHFVHDAMADPLVARWLEKLEHREIIPTVPLIAGVSREDYYRTVVRRFSNSALGDTIPRLCLDGSNRQPKFVLPTIAARLEKGETIDGLALEVAMWCRYCHATRDDGTAIVLDDPNADRIHAHALRARENPAAFLEMSDIFGTLAYNPRFVDAFSKSLSALWKNGVRNTLEAWLAD